MKIRLLTVSLLLMASILVLTKCNPITNGSVDQTDTTALTDTATSNALVRLYKWSYEEDEDKMTSKKTFYAIVNSPTELNFDFPYEGSAAALTLRHKRGSTDIILQITKGQFITPMDGTYIKARFDDLPASSYSCSEPSDNSSTVLFIDNTSRFLSNLKKHRKLIIEAEFYQEGLRQIEFDISNLKWDH